MKVIWVSPAVPHPNAAGGWAHEFELLKSMAPRHQIEVVSGDLDSVLDPQPLLDAGVGYTRVPWTAQPHSTSKLVIAATMLRADPNMVLWLKRDRMRALVTALRDLCARFQPDLVHLTLGELAPLIGVAPCPTALLLFDSLTRELEGRLALEQLPRRRAQYRVERRRTERYERHWYRQASGLASVSSVDARWFEQLLGRPVEVIENPIADAFFEEPDRPRSTNVVTFVGTLNHHPNFDAIEWLARDIWPLVRKRAPQAELRVVGRGDRDGLTTAKVRAIVESAGGRLDADVDDIRPSYWEAAVVVAPIRLGAGMRNKVIHAMACRAPVVATPAAMEGVDIDAASSVRVGTTADDLAELIVATLEDPGDAAARAAIGATGVEALHASAIADRFERWWERSASAQRTNTP